MAHKKKPPDSESRDHLQELRKFGKKAAANLFKQGQKSDLDDLDEKELASGSAALTDKSDAELFPDEIEEYTAKERKPKLVVRNKLKK